MAARENSISDSSHVDLNIFCPDVDQHDLETPNSRINHHLQIVLSGQSGFDREALASADMLFCRRQNLTRGRNRKCCGRPRLQCSRDCVRIQNGNRPEDIRVPACQSCLTGTVGPSDDSQSGTIQREDEEDWDCCFRWRSARISCKRFLSMATPARAAWAILCASSIQFTAILIGYAHHGLGCRFLKGRREVDAQQKIRRRTVAE